MQPNAKYRVELLFYRFGTVSLSLGAIVAWGIRKDQMEAKKGES